MAGDGISDGKTGWFANLNLFSVSNYIFSTLQIDGDPSRHVCHTQLHTSGFSWWNLVHTSYSILSSRVLNAVPVASSEPEERPVTAGTSISAHL